MGGPSMYFSVNAPDKPMRFSDFRAVNPTKQEIQPEPEPLPDPPEDEPEPPVALEGDPYITATEAREIYDDLAPLLDESIRQHCRKFVHDWCKAHGLTNDKGVGTLRKVKRFYQRDGRRVSGITEVREKLTEFLKDINCQETENR